MALNKGRWLLIYSKITEWEWYDDIYTCRVFLHLLLTANWKSTVWKGIQIDRGQRIVSYRKLADECSLTVQQTRTAIKHLETTQDITRSQNGKYTVITVNNYNEYQGDNTISNTETTQTSTQNQHDKQQKINTGYNNYKNSNNFNNSINELCMAPQAEPPPTSSPEKHKRSSAFIKPTLDEIKKFCTDNSLGIDAEYFYDYYESNGWKIGRNPMKDWKATVRNWARKDKKSTGTNKSAVDNGSDLDGIL